MFCVFTVCRRWCGYRKRPGRLILSVRTPYDGFFYPKNQYAYNQTGYNRARRLRRI